MIMITYLLPFLEEKKLVVIFYFPSFQIVKFAVSIQIFVINSIEDSIINDIIHFFHFPSKSDTDDGGLMMKVEGCWFCAVCMVFGEKKKKSHFQHLYLIP